MVTGLRSFSTGDMFCRSYQTTKGVVIRSADQTKGVECRYGQLTKESVWLGPQLQRAVADYADAMIDIREYDVPYHMRWLIDTEAGPRGTSHLTVCS